jgi:hypothetical protein
MKRLSLAIAAFALAGCNSLNPKHGAMCVHAAGAGIKFTVAVYGEAKPRSAMNTPECAVAIENSPFQMPVSPQPLKGPQS